jgi:hypothetical protein
MQIPPHRVWTGRPAAAVREWRWKTATWFSPECLIDLLWGFSIILWKPYLNSVCLNKWKYSQL